MVAVLSILILGLSIMVNVTALEFRASQYIHKHRALTCRSDTDVRVLEHDVRDRTPL